jgi:hypothetical protein
VNSVTIGVRRTSVATTTPGRKFFDEHMAYIYGNKIDQMIDDQYTPDAVLFSPFDVLNTPPPHVVRGNKALKDFFHTYVSWQGAIQVEKLYDFAETGDSIFFQAIFTSRTGKWVVGDAWHMRGGKIDVHYSFAHKIGDAP